MPSGIYLPPWLQPVDRIGPFMQGVSQGVNMARTALAAQAQAFEAQQAQQQLALRQQQEERAVATAVAGVIAQKEEQKRQQAIVDMKAQQAARQFQYQDIYAQRVAAGEDPAKVLMEIGPQFGINPATAMSAISRQNMAEQRQAEPIYRTVPGVGLVKVDKPTGATQTVVPQPQRQDSFQQREQADNWATELRVSRTAYDKAKKALDAYKQSPMRQFDADLKVPGAADVLRDLDADEKAAKQDLERLKRVGQERGWTVPDEATESNPTEQAVKSQLEAITPKATATKVRRKSDGKVFTYKGSKIDIPLDKFEILE